ncbi:hypothetical protein WJX84_008915 [Apatococcus fuscideae]|uniref:Methionyl-tRNA formyltransferase, mitochondrial n=1 Tax=Apatococcus fuscideae TaxID=2026836 RepID=A0AAW1SM08_9CHLO
MLTARLHTCCVRLPKHPGRLFTRVSGKKWSSSGHAHRQLWCPPARGFTFRYGTALQRSFCSSATAASPRSVVFLGSPEVAAEVLKHLTSYAKSEENCSYEISAVVTQPWAARGRSRKPKPSFVEEAAVQCGIPDERIFCPASAKDAGFLESLAALKPDLCVTAAYGNILPQAFLDIPTFGTLNIHPSLLPKFRGAAPVQRALQEGAEESGVSLAFTVRTMDAGPIVAQEVVNMSRYQDADEALQSLFQIGAQMLVQHMPRIWSGAAAAEARPQDESQATSAPKLRKEDAVLDFTKAAHALANQIRAFSSWPGSRASFTTREPDDAASEPFDLKITRAAVYQGSTQSISLSGQPGCICRTPAKEILAEKDEQADACVADGALPHMVAIELKQHLTIATDHSGKM